jgi:hypothetical protein
VATTRESSADVLIAVDTARKSSVDVLVALDAARVASVRTVGSSFAAPEYPGSSQ